MLHLTLRNLVTGEVIAHWSGTSRYRMNQLINMAIGIRDENNLRMVGVDFYRVY
jgi:hypothetical protein